MTNVPKATQQLYNLGQSLWLDNVTRDLLYSGTLRKYIQELSVTGVTSNPTIFDHAIKNSAAYDGAIRRSLRRGLGVEQVFFDLALEDVTGAADLLWGVHERTKGADGWVSLEVSPQVAHDAARTIAAAVHLHARAKRPNVFIKIPGTKEGIRAIEEAVFNGIPVNVTLLFSHDQYLASAEAFLRGVERRIDTGLDPDVASVASVLISRWDTAVAAKVPQTMQNQLGIAVGKQTFKSYRTFLSSARWQRAMNFGARPQRLLFASTGTEDPNASDIHYIKALAAPFTVNTMPENTLKAFGDHGELNGVLPDDGGDAETVLAKFTQAGINVPALAAQLQDEGVEAFVKSWEELMGVIATKGDALKKVS